MTGGRKDRPLALRVPPETLKRIDKLAKDAGLSRTQYMIRSALGELRNPRAADEVLADHEDRIARLEAAQFGG